MAHLKSSVRYASAGSMQGIPMPQRLLKRTIYYMSARALIYRLTKTQNRFQKRPDPRCHPISLCCFSLSCIPALLPESDASKVKGLNFVFGTL